MVKGGGKEKRRKEKVIKMSKKLSYIFIYCG